MDVYERVIRAMNFEEPDRVPIWETLDNDKIYEKFGGTGDPLEVSAKAHKRLGIDVIRSWFYGPNKDWLKVKLEDVWGKFLGIDSSKFKYVRKEYISWISERPFNDIDGLRDNLPDFPDEKEVGPWYEENFKKQLKAFYPEVVLLGGTEGPLEEAYTYAGRTLFIRAMYSAPDIVRKLLDIFTSYATIITKVYAENEFGPAFFVAEDIAYKKGLMFPLNWLRKELLPRLKKIAQPLKAKGIKFVFHSDGNLYSIIDDLINIGIDGLTPIEPAAGMEMAYMKKKYGDKIFLVGNIDCSITLPFGSKEDVIKETKKCIDDAAEGGGLLIGSSSEIHDGIPIENALAMFETVKKYGKYPLKKL
jgi:uroporphyrinogen-III decarboxylase